MKKLIVFVGLALASTAAAADAPRQTDQSDKVRCKRVAETGSHVRSTKVCMKDRQWRELREKARQEAGDLANPTGGMRTSG